jgi:hypothetical protein
MQSVPDAMVGTAVILVLGAIGMALFKLLR